MGSLVILEGSVYAWGRLLLVVWACTVNSQGGGTLSSSGCRPFIRPVKARQFNVKAVRGSGVMVQRRQGSSASKYSGGKVCPVALNSRRHNLQVGPVRGIRTAASGFAHVTVYTTESQFNGVSHNKNATRSSVHAKSPWGGNVCPPCRPLPRPAGACWAVTSSRHSGETANYWCWLGHYHWRLTRSFGWVNTPSQQQRKVKNEYGNGHEEC